jgi:hypothetical protein
LKPAAGAPPQADMFPAYSMAVWVLADLGAEPVVSGVAEPKWDVEFIDIGNGNRFKTSPEKTTGTFLTRLPAGAYNVQFQQKTMEVFLAGGSQRHLDFVNFIAFSLAKEKKDGKPILKVKADGEGKHNLTLLGSNLKTTSPHHTLAFELGISDSTWWPIEPLNPREPVVVVVYADDNLTSRRTLFFWPD